MPQMAPIWWTIIMMITILLFLTTMIVNYFNFSKKINTKFNFNYLSKFNWKW